MAEIEMTDHVDPFGEMVEEFNPIPPRNLDTCNALRMAGYIPYATFKMHGKQYEVISMPFPQDGVAIKGSGCGIGLLIRYPSDPTSMFEWSIPRRIVRAAVAKFR